MNFIPEVGKPCSFYHEGGMGDRHWVIGWRYGIVIHIPARGKREGWVRVEVPVDLWHWDFGRKMWVSQPHLIAWVPRANVNAVGDTTYHGPTTLALTAERRAAKREEQERADKKRAAGRRFHR